MAAGVRRSDALRVLDDTSDVEHHERPRTRADCENGERPCPWVSCKMHLLLDVMPSGSLRLHNPTRRRGGEKVLRLYRDKLAKWGEYDNRAAVFDDDGNVVKPWGAKTPRADGERYQGEVADDFDEQALERLESMPHTCALDVAEDMRRLQEIADDLGVSRERVRQIESDALRKLARHPDAKTVLKQFLDRIADDPPRRSGIGQANPKRKP